MYSTRKANWTELCEKLIQIWNGKGVTTTGINRVEETEDLEKFVQAYTSGINEVCDSCIPKLKSGRDRPWWNDDLAKQKKEVTRLKRRIPYAAPIRREWVVKQYVEAKEKYLAEAKRAQSKSWKSLAGNNVG